MPIYLRPHLALAQRRVLEGRQSLTEIVRLGKRLPLSCHSLSLTRTPVLILSGKDGLTLDFLLRQAIHAVLTHLLLLAAAASLSFLRDLDLFEELEGEATGLMRVLS